MSRPRPSCDIFFEDVILGAVLRACLAIRAKRMPEQWLTFNTRSMLGAALLGQRKYNEAEPLLLDGYQGMKHGQAQVEFQVSAKQGQARLAQALERLVELYEATGQKEKADQWRQKLKSGSH